MASTFRRAPERGGRDSTSSRRPGAVSSVDLAREDPEPRRRVANATRVPADSEGRWSRKNVVGESVRLSRTLTEMGNRAGWSRTLPNVEVGSLPLNTSDKL